MTGEKIFEAIGVINDKYLEKCEDAFHKGRHLRVSVFAGLTAACLCIVTAGALIIPRLGGNDAPMGGNGSGSDRSSVFMSYAGPVFPLSLLEKDDEISAERNITLDFAPWNGLDGYLYNDLIVRDGYTLTNTSQTDKSVTVVYPFASSIRELGEHIPQMTADGIDVETKMFVGKYTGAFQDAWGGGDSPTTTELKSWENYADLLSDGAYLENTLNCSVDFSDVPVTVYKFSDAYCDDDVKAPNPTVRATFYQDYSRTKVLSYGFNGGKFYDDISGRSFSISSDGIKYMVVLGEDISSLEIGYYVTGGFDEKKKLPEGSAGVTVSRYETNLDEILREIVAALLSDFYRDEKTPLDFEEYYSMFCEYLESCGILAESSSKHYNDILWDSDFDYCKRVMYVTAKITVPAGRSVELRVSQTKDASYDYYCTSTENRDVNGYDAVTRVGTNLQFTKLSANIENYGKIEIIRQNFGFDPDSGVTGVVLDAANPHYYIEVRRKTDTNA